MRNKIRSWDELKKISDELKKKGKVLAFTNGCFDLLHTGHIRYLYAAKALGDILIVAINSNRSVRKLKDQSRPIVDEDDRQEIIAALEMVDYVTLFDDLTCSSLLRYIQPDIYVKGGDYNPDNLPEWQVVQEYGGQVEFIKVVSGRSTSGIIRSIQEARSPGQNYFLK